MINVKRRSLHKVRLHFIAHFSQIKYDILIAFVAFRIHPFCGGDMFGEVCLCCATDTCAGGGGGVNCVLRMHNSVVDESLSGIRFIQILVVLF